VILISAGSAGYGAPAMGALSAHASSATWVMVLVRVSSWVDSSMVRDQGKVSRLLVGLGHFQ